jgi:LmbE family N-acetylglucosaminyl deacetylase
MSILVVAAHPDDEVLGCGGTIALLTRQTTVNIAILGEGITSRFSRRKLANSALLQELQQQSREAAKLLGAADLFSYGLPDNRFDTVPLLDVVKLVEELIERSQPEVIYTHHGGDLNMDHVIVSRAVLTATRPVAGSPVKQVLAFEVPSSTEWCFASAAPPFRPNVFVDVSETLETKLQAMALYENEVRQFPHPRSAEALRIIASRWGTVAGMNAVEAFELIRCRGLTHS